MKRFSLPRTLVAALTLLAFFAGQETWALAGVTGNIAGTIKDTNGTPIAGAQVQAVSPSQTKSATTDAAGHFIILSLAPDTYTLNLSKAGYQTASFPGVVVFADQSQQVAYALTKSLVTIGHVTAQSGASLVKSGVGSDLYSVNAAQAAAAASLGGGGNLNNAYSALASVPGVQTSQGGMGWNFNATYVRGQNSYYTGYEYDGIPVNRAFDNYNSSNRVEPRPLRTASLYGRRTGIGRLGRYLRLHQPSHQDRLLSGLCHRESRHRHSGVLPSSRSRSGRFDSGPYLQLLRRALGLQPGLPFLR